MLKKYIVLLMLLGFLLFNCLFVGGYQIYKAAEDWLSTEKLQIEFLNLETSDILQIKKEAEAELKFRGVK